MKSENLIIQNKFSSAIENLKKKNLDYAQKLFEEILKIDPNHFNSICHLGLIFSNTKKFELASKMFLSALKINPENASIYNNLGNIYFELGDIQKSLNFFSNAIKVDPNFIDAHFNSSLVLKSIGKLNEAIDHLNIIIKINPDDIRAYINIALILQNKGQIKKSIEYFIKAINIDPNNLTAINLFLQLIKSVKLVNLKENNAKEIKNIFYLLLSKNNINHNDLFNNAKSILFSEEDIKNFLQLSNSGTLQIINEKLNNNFFFLILQKCLIRDISLEKLLIKIREILIYNKKNFKQDTLEDYKNFIISLAIQSFLNEYVYFQTDDEINFINNLEKKISTQEKINELDIALLACYKPLYNSKILTNKLMGYSSKNDLFNEMLKLQIIEPVIENDLKKTIKSIEKISDKTSKKVKQQYEENPYPRWRFAKTKISSPFLNNLKNEIFPNKFNFKNNFSKPDVLIAGCGTGSHLANTIYYLNSNITAVDLSLSSLAYAKRKIEEIGYKNINYLNGDILSLKNLNNKFDIVECIGVLHHMERPLDGLKVLLELLKSDGVLKLGLYSELARKDVIKVRDFIKKEGFNSSLEDIRHLREIIKSKTDDIFYKKISFNYDFYSTSNLRDLVFHVKEHRYSIIDLIQIFEDFNLEFLGFTNPDIKKKYSMIFPDDQKAISLQNWDKFEKKYTTSFVDMYQFWVKKKN